MVYVDTVGCGASQCPVPGEPGNFIAGTNGQNCESTTGGATVDAVLCWDGIYRPPGSCPVRPPAQPTPTTPQQPRVGSLEACRSGTAVRLAWSAVTVANAQTGNALGGWQVQSGIQGSSATTAVNIAAADRSYERSLSTSNAWTITITPVLSSGTVGQNSASINIPTGNPVWGQCTVLALPTPTVTACRSIAGVEVEWTVPSGRWATGTGWVMDVNIWLGGNSISTYLSAYSATDSSLIPWSDRSITLPIPAGDGIRIGLLAYDGSYGTDAQDTAEAQPEPGCGGVPPTPAAPAALADPSPRLTCGPATFDGNFPDWADSAAANWERESEYEVEYEDSSSVWQTLTLTENSRGNYEFSGPTDPGNAVDIRVRARGRQRQRVGGVWSAWSDWSAWSTQYAHSTPRCPATAPPIPAPPSAAAPTSLAVDCTAASGIFTAQATWDAPSNTSTMQYRHTISWSVDASGTITTYSAGPQSGRSASISSVSQTLGVGDVTTVSVTTEARARAFVNGRYSAWSAFGAASAAATATDSTGCPTPVVHQPCTGSPSLLAAVYPAGHPEPYTDANRNGVWDPGEVFIDLDGDLTWTADVGGVPTGDCWPPGHVCLQPDEVCLPMGS